MTRATILESLLKVLRQIQERTGEEPVVLEESSVPLRELPKFDSLLALEATVEVETELGCPGDENLFYDEGSKRALTIGEIVDRLRARLGFTEKVNG